MPKGNNKPKATKAPIRMQYIREGTNNDATCNTLKKQIGQLAKRKGLRYYVGKACGSNPPIKRWYNKYKKMNYKQMFVLCVTETEQEALDLEDMIIDYYTSDKYIRKQQAKKDVVITLNADDGTSNSNEGVSSEELEIFEDNVYQSLIDNKTGGGGGRHGSGCGYVYLVTM